MTDIDVTLTLNDALVDEAREYGLLTGERIAALLDAELKRVKAWRQFQQALEGIHAASRDHFGDLSEDEVMAMMDSEVKSVRAEQKQIKLPCIHLLTNRS